MKTFPTPGHPSTSGGRPTLAFLAVLSFAATALFGADGVIEINHSRAVAGGVTPGDLPGYPVTLTVPGSYRLTGNLTIPDENTVGVDVAAERVTLDLGGFAIQGPSICTGSGGDISCTVSGFGNGIVVVADHVSIVGGTIAGCGGSGVLLGAHKSIVLRDLRLLRNAGSGIDSHASELILLDSAAVGNGEEGIFATGDLVVHRSLFANNRGDGVVTQAGGLFKENVFRDNFVHGLSLQDGIVLGNSSVGNAAFGYSLTSSVAYGENQSNDNPDGDYLSGVELGANVCSGATC